VAGLLAVLVALVVTVTGAPATAEPVGADEVYRTLQIESVPARYVILVDTSASMQQGTDLYGQLRVALRAHLAALSPDDTVALVTFDNVADVVFNGPVGTNPDAVLGRLPARATGDHTDIGRALELGLTLLSSSNAPVGNVLLFTDGRHDPPPGSPYPYVEGGSWEQLRRSAGALKMDHLTGFSVPLRPGAGVELLRTIVPDAQELTVTSIGALARDLEVPKRAGRVGKARSVLGPDTRGGVVAEWHRTAATIDAGETRLTLVLRSTTKRIPLTVTDLAVDSSSGTVRVRAPAGPVTVPPAGRVPVDVEVEWDPADGQVKATLTARAVVDSSWSPVIRQDLGLTFQPQLTGERATLTGTVDSGPSWWWLAGATVALLLLAAGLWFWHSRLRTPPMSGTLEATSPLSGDVYGRLPLSGRRMTFGRPEIGVPGAGTVRGVRIDTRPAVRIGYSPNGVPERSTTADCPADTSMILNGVGFRWVTDGSAKSSYPPQIAARGPAMPPRHAVTPPPRTPTADTPRATP
jgi:hypothetical protein